MTPIPPDTPEQPESPTPTTLNASHKQDNALTPSARGHHRRARLRPWLKVLLLLVIFVCGMIGGSGLTVMVIVQRLHQGMNNPAQRAVNWTNRLTRKLDLDTTQSDAVLRVMTDASMRFEDIRRDLYPRVQTELDRMEREVAAVLPPDKAKQWREQFNHLREHWLPAAPNPKQQTQ
jgi:hypothetical protein